MPNWLLAVLYVAACTGAVWLVLYTVILLTESSENEFSERGQQD